ncbi:MAG: thiamine pyrophosphate-dependent enzyme [Bacillota bacterium]
MNPLAMREPGKRVLLMGNEAIARGALEGGLEVAAAYPGTPSSEVLEALSGVAEELGIYVEWSTNEKIAMEVAVGASLVGRRSLVAMKNAGLNWAMDTFMTVPYGGIRGGCLVVVADDPGAHYSSTEQDTRVLGRYAEIPVLEPMDQPETKEMARVALELSERLEIPVFLRSVTRISHASGDVEMGGLPGPREGAIGFNKHWKVPYRFNVYGPPGPVSKHRWLHSRIPLALEWSERSPFNEIRPGGEYGVIASGLGAAYVLDQVKALSLEGEITLLKIGVPWPLPVSMVRKVLRGCRRVLVVEEGDPVVEEQVKALAHEEGATVEVWGKGDGQLPACGELDPDLVAGALAGLVNWTSPADSLEGRRQEVRQLVSPRSSALCPGCGHLGAYWGISRALRKERIAPVVNGDIGCYEQGGYGLFSCSVAVSDEPEKIHKVTSPYEVLDTIHVMGSGIGLAQGQFHGGHQGKILAVAGDSTYFHATLPAVANAVVNNANVTFVVLDNRWTAMTGHQPSPRTGRNAVDRQVPVLDIEAVAGALGVRDTRRVDAYDLPEVERAVEEALASDGFSLVLVERECALQVARRVRPGRAETRVDEGICIGCRICLGLGCPALVFRDKKASIDVLACVDCGMCQQVCPSSAIVEGVKG